MMPDSAPSIDRIKRQIVQRLFLRKPQEESLDLFVDILKRLDLSKDASVIKQLEEVKDAYPNITDFERNPLQYVLRLQKVLARQG